MLRFTRKFVGGGGDEDDSVKGSGGSSVGGFSGLTGSRGTDVLVAEFDNLTRRSAISQTSYLGDGFKAGICLDSLNVSLLNFLLLFFNFFLRLFVFFSTQLFPFYFIFSFFITTGPHPPRATKDPQARSALRSGTIQQQRRTAFGRQGKASTLG